MPRSSISFPRTNIPDTFDSWGEFEQFCNLLIKTNCIDNAKKIWWDIRPHPFFNTIEVRICDIPMRADETIAIAALIQATACKLCKLHASNQDCRQYSRALLMENKWRAVRYGLDGKLIDFGKETEVAERELILEYLAFIDDCVDELGSRRGIWPTSGRCSTRAPAPTASSQVQRDRWRPENGRRLHGGGDARRPLLTRLKQAGTRYTAAFPVDHDHHPNPASRRSLSGRFHSRRSQRGQHLPPYSADGEGHDSSPTAMP